MWLPRPLQAGSSSPVSSISGFSTNSHLEDTATEPEGKEAPPKPDPFAPSSSSSGGDPFAAFSVGAADTFGSAGELSPHHTP